MADKQAVFAAVILHYFLRILLFFEVPKTGGSSAPDLASTLFFGSTIMLLKDTNIFPQKYQRLSKTLRLSYEVLMCVVIIEFAMIFFWYRVETIIQKIIKCALSDEEDYLYYELGGDYLTGFLITSLSVFIFINVMLITENYVATKKFGKAIYTMIFMRIKTLLFRQDSCKSPCDAKMSDISDLTTETSASTIK